MDEFAELTVRQARIYAFVREAIQTRGFGPSIREIGRRFGIRSPNGVTCHLKALEKKGYIRRARHSARAITLVRDGVQKPSRLPIAGRVAAGSLEEAIEQQETLDLARLTGDGNRFAVQVLDDGLIEEHIRAGDYLLFERAATTQEEGIAAIRDTLGRITLCRVRPDGSGTRLGPLFQDANLPTDVPTETLGKLVAVVRGR